MDLWPPRDRKKSASHREILQEMDLLCGTFVTGLFPKAVTGEGRRHQGAEER
jgi:hypothetical protein